MSQPVLDNISLIHRLPAELVGLVAQQCDSETFFNLRQTCRWINDLTLAVFTNTYFSTRAVMLQRQSLEVLLQISLHPVFGPAITTLVVTMQHFLDNEEIAYLLDTDQIMTTEEENRLLTRELRQARRGERSSNNSDESDEGSDESDVLAIERDREAYHRGFRDQTSLQQLGLDAAYLVSIMDRLPNCASVEIGGDDCGWGSTLIERSCGIRLHWGMEAEEHHSSTIFITRAFQLVLGALHISSIEIHNLWITLTDVSDLMLALPGLDTTMLRDRFRTISHLKLGQLHMGQSTAEPPHLAGFLSLFSSLQIFVLKIVNDSFGTRTSEIFGNVIRIPNLKKLSLRGGSWTGSMLSQLVLRHQATLTEVQFRSINLIGENHAWVSVLRSIKVIPSIQITIQYCRCNRRHIRLEDIPEEARDGVRFLVVKKDQKWLYSEE
jgi:hypothetical protein